ncbi:expressed unknown protein [Seminavis robusta]|uniref:Uncharacterized protein n=1 Tax=Seminavis robusta TaxID=568900 RepID=A0A9N8EHE8_9STRA|nr:expressed unknown protein [Seminavis robusta]|eukprot:Sro1137_g245290.1 n/a (93) ;mRNA; r:16794-17072
MEDNPGLAAIQETVVKTTDQETAVHKDSVDLALLGTLASFATLGMLLGLSFNSGIIQSIENSDNGSAATFIVDVIFGAIALFVSLVSGPDDV